MSGSSSRVERPLARRGEHARRAARARCAARTAPGRRCGTAPRRAAARRGSTAPTPWSRRTRCRHRSMPGCRARRREHARPRRRTARSRRPARADASRRAPSCSASASWRGGRRAGPSRRARTRRSRWRRAGRRARAPRGARRRRRPAGPRGRGAGTRDEDRLGPRERLEPVGHVVREAVAAGDRPGCRAAHAHLVGHARAGAEHLRRDADVERLRALEHEHGDAMVAAGHPARMACFARIPPAAIDHGIVPEEKTVPARGGRCWHGENQTVKQLEAVVMSRRRSRRGAMM